MYDLDGNVAIITGGASGMGRAASLLFARAGANVVVADLNDAGGEEVAKLASESGNQAVFQHTDVSVEGDIQALVARATETFGRLDVMFNNAGIGGATAGPQASAPKPGRNRRSRFTGPSFERVGGKGE